MELAEKAGFRTFREKLLQIESKRHENCIIPAFPPNSKSSFKPAFDMLSTVPVLNH